MVCIWEAETLALRSEEGTKKEVLNTFFVEVALVISSSIASLRLPPVTALEAQLEGAQC
jgi:hypothetical protein